MIKAERDIKRQVSEYLRIKLIDQARVFYKLLTVSQAGAALERANMIVDCLVFYENIYANTIWLAHEHEILFAKQRWLVCKYRQAELASNDRAKARLRHDAQTKRLEWQVTEAIESFPEHPTVDLDEKPNPPEKPIAQPELAETESTGDDSQKAFDTIAKPESPPTQPDKVALIPLPPSPNISIDVGELNALPESSAPVSVPPSAPLPEITLQLEWESHKFICIIMRERATMVIKGPSENQIATVKARSLRVISSDDEDLEIELIAREESKSEYWIKQWNLTCLMQRVADAVYAELCFGNEKIELVRVRVM